MSNRRETVCILTAGLGSRMAPLDSIINKALLPVNERAVITHIIEKFPKDSRFIIAVGHFKQQVKDYLDIVHADLEISYVEVDKYMGPNTGPGYSLLCCEDYLKCPFYFVSCDTMWDKQIDSSLNHNWVAVADAEYKEADKYCNIKVINGKVEGVVDKQRPNKSEYECYSAFTGLAFIKDWDIFWSGIKDPTLIEGERQVSLGLDKLIKSKKVKPYYINWIDVGTYESYKKIIGENGDFDFSKENEFLYILDGKVIKFFSDQDIVKNRVNRAKKNQNVFPEIKFDRGQFYGYEFIEGKTLYERNNRDIFRRFLEWSKDNLWMEPKELIGNFEKSCHDFYYSKTNLRVEMYYEKYNLRDGPQRVNGKQIPTTSELLEKIDWSDLCDGCPVQFHGDLQFDNILYDNEKDVFKLIDWRQDFGNGSQCGDIYYDLAKLYGGILVNYDLMKKNYFTYSEHNGSIWIEYLQRSTMNDYIDELSIFVEENQYDMAKVKMLAALIHLNMAPLHMAPFDNLLYALGRLELHELTQ